MTEKELDSFDPRKYIVIKGARLHNLKNINLAIPQKKLVVITGLSGSGKSSLAFDTLYAEGQRRYVESLSAYARQFLGRLDKPEVDWIKGISPAVAIEQKVTSRNPRSTVGTSTEIYDYLKVLFARIGRTFSPETGTEVKRHTVSDVLKEIYQWEEGTRFYITCPVPFNGRGIEETLKILEQQGFSRLMNGEEVHSLGEFKVTMETRPENLQLVIDRAVVKKGDEDQDNRMADSIQTAFYEGHGLLQLVMADFSDSISFSNSFEADGITFEEPSLHLFSFNNPYGACKTCEGFGSVIGIDEDLVIPNPTLSVFEEAIAPWKGEKMSEWREPLLNSAHKFDFPLHRAYLDLSAEEKELLWSGNKHFKGLRAFFKYIESKSYKIQFRVMLSRYRGKTQCGTCNGTRLRPESSYVKIDQFSIVDLVDLSVDDLVAFFKNLSLTDFEGQVAKRLLIEINNRLSYLQDVGLGYLTLNRVSGTLSGGESQRINLATSLGSSLVGSMYILDEPSIGLHPRDTQRLIKVVKNLRDHGNTVIVVEHDEEFMKAADYIIDIGPGAGRLGGEIINTGTYQELVDKGGSLTAEYLRGDKFIELPKTRRTAKHFIEIQGARENNLKGVDIRVPLEAFTVVTGVSGSGKSSLIKKILFPALSKRLWVDMAKKLENTQGLVGP